MPGMLLPKAELTLLQILVVSVLFLQHARYAIGADGNLNPFSPLRPVIPKHLPRFGNDSSHSDLYALSLSLVGLHGAVIMPL